MSKYPVALYYGKLETLNNIPQYAKAIRCIECNRELVVRKGVIYKHHFAHKAVGNCLSYSNKDISPESELHINAKDNICTLYSNPITKSLIITKRICCKDETIDLIEQFPRETHIICQEFPIKLSDGSRGIADVAILERNTRRVAYIIEIRNTHRTEEYARLGFEWSEINAVDLNKTELAYDFPPECSKFRCVRIYRTVCQECVDENEEKLAKIEFMKNKRINEINDKYAVQDFHTLQNMKERWKSRKIAQDIKFAELYIAQDITYAERRKEQDIIDEENDRFFKDMSEANELYFVKRKEGRECVEYKALFQVAIEGLYPQTRRKYACILK
jgi:hypothetical protein